MADIRGGKRYERFATAGVKFLGSLNDSETALTHQIVSSQQFTGILSGQGNHIAHILADQFVTLFFLFIRHTACKDNAIKKEIQIFIWISFRLFSPKSPLGGI
jgi:hypothetical protein